MASRHFRSLSDKDFNETIKRKSQKKKIPNMKNKKSNFFSYLYLFAFVFLGALWGLSYIIKSYTPEIDVSIGNNESFTLNDSEVDMEVRTIDERLKWIQMEDDLPSVSVRSSEKKYNNEEKRKKELAAKVPMPNIKELKTKQNEFRSIPAKEVIPLPKPVITKVYLGNYATLEDAAAVQNQIMAIEPEITPFVKSVKGHYIVQLGSFSDGARAGALAEKLTAKGYYPKINYEN